MRVLLKLKMDVEAANNAIDNGNMEKAIQNLVEMVNPEATFFTAESGKRTGYVFFDLTDASMIPRIAEPLFHHLKAEIDFMPVMNLEDLRKGLHSEGQRAGADQSARAQ